MTHSDQVWVERPDRHYAVLTIDHPPRNTLTHAGREALLEVLDTLAGDLDVRCIVLTGTGATFTAGNDLTEEATMPDSELPRFLRNFGAVFDAIERFRAPVIAAVNGAAIGGGLELALCCDLRIASTEATFVAAGVNVGLIANFYRLPRIVGEGPAKDLLLTGRAWSAEEALRWGLVTAVHEPDALLDAANRLARRISTRPPLSVEATKDAVRQIRHASLDEAMTLQGERFAAMFRTEDHAEAIRAFLEKRHADYHRR